MEIKNSKRGFAFTFFSFFLVIVIYTFASISFQETKHTESKQFTFERISSVNEEFLYFKDIYFKDILKISLSKNIWYISNKSESNYTFYSTFKDDYLGYNSLILEGISNGTLNLETEPFLDQYVLNNLSSTFRDNLLTNYKANLSFEVLKLNVYEKTPFYLSIQAKVNYSITLLDNLSSWDSTEDIILSFPVYDFKNPMYSILANYPSTTSPKITPVELFTSNQNWSLDLFNKTLQNDLASVYYDSDYKYTLGNSYLDSLFNETQGSYRNVIGFWSFDYDSDENQIYDTSQNNNLGSSYQSSTILHLPLENNVNDATDFPSTLIPTNIVYANNSPVGNSSVFNGVDSRIELLNDYKINQSLDFLSISFWQNSTLIDRDITPFFKLGSGPLLKGMSMEYNNGTNQVDFVLNCNTTYSRHYPSYTLLNDTWELISVVMDFKGSEISFYQNNLFLEKESIPSSCKNFNFEKNLFFGQNINGSARYKGSMDEILISNKKLSSQDISDLYIKQEPKTLDYVNTFLGKSIEFSNRTFLEINTNLSLNQDYSLSFWIKPTNNLTQNILHLKNNSDVNSINITKNSTNIIFQNQGNTLVANYSINQWNFYTLASKQGIDTKIFHNGIEENNILSDFSYPNLIDNVTISLVENSTNSFEGYFDELRIINSTTSSKLALLEYYNFESFAKGCCNYLTVVNPNKYGFNNLADKLNISYTTQNIINYHFKSIPFRNVTLYNITNITSDITTDNYYNFLADICMLQIYDVFSYFPGNNDAEIVHVGNDSGECSSLIKWGLY